MSTASCRACGALIGQQLERAAGTRAPCPRCGSTMRAFDVNQMEQAVAGDYRKRRIKRRQGGAKGKPYLEEIDGDDLWRNTGRWMHLTRTIDRSNGWYSEKVSDPRTGEVVRRCEEPLRAHRDRGSAKKR